MDIETARVVIPVVSAAMVSLIVASIGFTSAVVVMRRTLRNQRDLDVLKDARSIRDDKRERLRKSFEAVLLVAATIQSIVRERRFLLGTETVNERDARLQVALSRAVEDLDRTRVRLLLEAGATAIVDRFDQTFSAFRTVVMLQQLHRDQAEGITWQQIQEVEAEVEAGVKALEETMRGELAQLEALIDKLPKGGADISRTPR